MSSLIVILKPFPCLSPTPDACRSVPMLYHRSFDSMIKLVAPSSSMLVVSEREREQVNCGIRHVTVPIATRILIANVRHIGLSNICVINLVYFKMQV